jgi:hypothetical protein
MTFDTFAHAPDLGRQALKVLDFTMAFLTSYLFINVALVIEKNMFGYIVDFYPWGTGFRIEILMLLQNPGMPGNDVVVAVQTFLHRRYARKV